MSEPNTTDPIHNTHNLHSAVILREDNDADQPTLARLWSDPQIEVIDHRASLIHQFNVIKPAPTQRELAEPYCWAYYPWRRSVVAVPGPEVFRRLRLDRNRNKITQAEQEVLGRLTIGIVGLSVGHAIAHTLAMEGVCGRLRLADFDLLELSNLNRIPATVLDLGINKTVIAARRIAELDPYLPVEIETKGLTEETLANFVSGLDLVIEECDSLDMKVLVRQAARARGIPVMMETSDRGLFDVERFDIEPNRELFHGLLGAVDPQSLRGLSTRDKAPHVMRILEAGELSPRMAASVVEIDRTLSSWPQLGGDVQLGAATVAAAVRRFGRGEQLPSGRVRIDLDASLARLVDQSEPPMSIESSAPLDDLTLQVPEDPLAAVVHAIRLGPSGANSQPWSITLSGSTVGLHLTTERTSAMDVGFRGSYVAIGAAAFNARVAAAKHSIVGPITAFPADASSDGVTISLADGVDPELAALYPAMVKRMSNRSFGRREPLADPLAADLTLAARAEGARLTLISDGERLSRLAEVLAASDRVRYLTPLLHRQMMSELKWPGIDRLDAGIDVRTLGLDATDLAKLKVASRSEVMGYLARWNVGQALGDNTRDRVIGSSAMAVVTVNGDTPYDYFRGGSAVERVWIKASEAGLGVYPISPVFLYARNEQELGGLSAQFLGDLIDLQRKFGEIAELDTERAPVLLLRLSHQPGSSVRSGRLPLSEIVASPRQAASVA